MIDWLAEPVTLPRFVVWGALLTSPALWSQRFKKLLHERLPNS